MRCNKQRGRGRTGTRAALGLEEKQGKLGKSAKSAGRDSSAGAGGAAVSSSGGVGAESKETKEAKAGIGLVKPSRQPSTGKIDSSAGIDGKATSMHAQQQQQQSQQVPQ